MYILYLLLCEPNLSNDLLLPSLRVYSRRPRYSAEDDHPWLRSAATSTVQSFRPTFYDGKFSESKSRESGEMRGAGIKEIGYPQSRMWTDQYRSRPHQ